MGPDLSSILPGAPLTPFILPQPALSLWPHCPMPGERCLVPSHWIALLSRGQILPALFLPMGLEKSNLDPHLPFPCALYNVATGPKVEHAIGRWRGLNSRLGGSDEVTSSLPGTNACNTQGLSCAIASTVPPLLILPRVHRVFTDPYFN